MLSLWALRTCLFLREPSYESASNVLDNWFLLYKYWSIFSTSLLLCACDNERFFIIESMYFWDMLLIPMPTWSLTDLLLTFEFAWLFMPS